MSALPKNTPRRVVPRWRSSEAAALTGELTPIPVRQPASDPVRAQEELQRVTSDFRRNHTVGHATDLLSAAVVLDQPGAAIDAARFLLNTPRVAGPVATDLARRVATAVEAGAATLLMGVNGGILTHPTGQPRALVSDVQRLRRGLHDDPRNVLSWLDLSRVYAVIGETQKAERAVRAALMLAPNHRFALRSAARFFLHVGKADEAQTILRRSEATRRDPWLMAAEIAVSTVADRTPTMVKVARAALKARRHAPFHLGEVASALATLEANAGSVKTARKLFQQALVDPTENSIAQAEWAARDLRLFDFDQQLLRVDRTYEANTWAAYAGERWTDALAHARRWLADEPFSGRAAAIGSVIAGVALEEFDQAIAFARQGVLADPNDLLLRNNLVFTLAEAGHLQEGEFEHHRLRNAGLEGAARVVWLANGGLLAYRAHNVQAGRMLYEQSVAVAREIRNVGLERMAVLYWAGEELRAGLPGHDGALVDRALAEAREKATPDLRIAVQRLERIHRRQRELSGVNTPVMPVLVQRPAM